MKKGAIRIIRKLRLHGYEALFAGGFVRDLIMGRKSEDIDIATSALPDEVGQLFPGSIKTGARFGVIQAPMYGRFYEVTTFRSDDMYLDGRRPVSVSFSGPRQDALRRDFTVNGMFYDPEEERLIDFVGGRRDIRRKRIRTIGDPVKRFAEDKLRIMRAIRLSCSLEFTIVNETLTAIKQFAPDITQVSRERIRDELIKILTGPHPDAGVRLLHECGLLPHIVPEIASRQYVKKLGYVRSGAEALARTIFALSLLRKPSEALAFAALLHTIVEPSAANGLPEKPAGTSLPIGKICEKICRRLKLSKEANARIADLVTSQNDFLFPDELSRSAWMRLLRKPGIPDHLELLRVGLISKKHPLKVHSKWQTRLKEFRAQPQFTPLLRGEDIKAMGYKPGPVIGKMLWAIEDLQLEGTIKNREEAFQYIRTHFKTAV